MYEYKGKVTNVVDGDTLDIAVDLGFGISNTQRFRLLGIDTYETRLGRGTTEEDKIKGLAAKQYLIDMFAENPEVTIVSDKTGKYGRYLANITVSSGEKLNTLLEENNFVKE